MGWTLTIAVITAERDDYNPGPLLTSLLSSGMLQISITGVMMMKYLCVVSMWLVAIALPAQEKPVESPPNKRLVREIKCQDNTANCTQIQFTPDGKELLACDYPGGKITLWNVSTGEVLSLFDAGHGSRGSAQYFHLSSDGKTLFADDSHQRPHITEIQRDGKVMKHWTMDGAVKVWNLATGELLPKYQHKPPRFILSTRYAPDGLSFCTLEEPGGIYQARPPRAYSLWDVHSREAKPLPADLMGFPTYSSDGKTLAVVIGKKEILKKVGGEISNESAKEMVFLDVKTLKVLRHQPLKSSLVTSLFLTYSSDDKWLIGRLRLKDDGEGTGHWTPQIIVWNAQTGEEVFSHTGEAFTDWGVSRTSPDGRYLTLTNWYPPIDSFKEQLPKERRGKLQIIDLPARKLAHQVMLTEPVTSDSTVSVSNAVIHPHGKVAVMTSRIFRHDDIAEEGKEMQSVGKPTFHCVELATGKVIERFESSLGNTIAFSPDGKLLACSCKGGIQLWNVADWRKNTSPPR